MFDHFLQPEHVRIRCTYNNYCMSAACLLYIEIDQIIHVLQHGLTTDSQFGRFPKKRLVSSYVVTSYPKCWPVVTSYVGCNQYCYLYAYLLGFFLWSGKIYGFILGGSLPVTGQSIQGTRIYFSSSMVFPGNGMFNKWYLSWILS